MADHSPSSAFPSLHWTEGEPSVLFDFSFSGGEKGAYELLALDETLGEVELCKQLKGLVMEDLKVATAVGAELPNARLGAALVIACARSSEQQDDLYSHWDELCGTLFSVEAHLGLVRRCLPVPSGRTGILERTLPLYLLPAMLTWDVDEPEEEEGEDVEAKDQAAAWMAGSWLIDFRTNDSKVLIAGKIRDGIPIPGPPLYQRASWLFSPAPPSSAPPSAVAVRRPLAGVPGLSGISEAQLKKLVRRGGVTKGAGGGMVSVGGASMKRVVKSSWENTRGLSDQFAYLREGARRANEHRMETNARLAELEKAAKGALKEVEQLRQELEVSKARKIKQKRLTTVESDLAAEKALPKIHLPTAALSLLPPALQLVNRLEPLATAVQPFKPLVPSRLLGIAQKSRELLVEAGETGRLKEENEQLRRQLQSVQGPAHPPSVLALSRLDLDRPSDRAAYVVRRLVERLSALQRKLRDVEEENIDLLLQLAGE
ncbi:hypothetical protein JCM10213_004384 [Rhodosporidiobolus nylandii]